MQRNILKRVLLFFILFSIQVCLGQNNYIGYVFEEEEGTPVFGASIMMHKNILAITDENGYFKINSAYDEGIFIEISHLSYDTLNVKLQDLNKAKDLKLFLKPKIQVLNEVVIRAYSDEEILKKMFTQFKNYYTHEDYIAPIKYDQIITNGGNVASFLQVDGYMGMPFNTYNAFIYPYILPEQIRRTNEKREIVQKWATFGKNNKEFPYNQLSGIIARTIWNNYGFFEVYNPASVKEKKNYTYKVIGIQNNDSGERVYKIGFNQERKMSNKGWELNFVYGEIILDFSTFVVKSISFSFKLENREYNSFNINYTLHNDRLFPDHIGLTSFRFEKNDPDLEEIVIKGELQFQDFNKYIYNDGVHFIRSYIWFRQQANYNPTYWKNRQYLSENFKDAIEKWKTGKALDNSFLEGYKQGDFYEKGEFSNLNLSEFDSDVEKFKTLISNK